MTPRTLTIADAARHGAEPIRPTRQRIAKGDGVIIPVDDERTPHIKKPARVENFSPLERYKNRGTLDPEQLGAGERYSADWFLSQRAPRVTGSYAGKTSPSNSEIADKAAAAGQRRDRAIMFLDTKDTAYYAILEHVCVQERAAETWAIGHKLHPMRGIKTLRLALDALAVFYGLKKP